jgi:hypothetical protein
VTRRQPVKPACTGCILPETKQKVMFFSAAAPGAAKQMDKAKVHQFHQYFLPRLIDFSAFMY